MNRNRQLLAAIYAKTKGRCWYCGSFHGPFSDWQIEHQNPCVRGGSDDLENLVMACAGCNAAKGKRTVEEYRAFIIAKLENAITNAREISDEIEGLVGWEIENRSDSETMHPPLWLMEVDQLLLDATRKAAERAAIFYGETLLVNSPTYTVIQSESIA